VFLAGFIFGSVGICGTQQLVPSGQQDEMADSIAIPTLSALVPFVEFTAFWVALGQYSLDSCYLTHAVGAVILGAWSIYQGNESQFVENLLVRYSFGYFVGHGFESIRQKKSSPTMNFHHALALTLLVGVLLNPEFIAIKATSNVLLTEFSTVFLYLWEKHPSEHALGAFVVTYFISRGVFLGYFLVRVFTTTDPLDPASMVPIGAFHYFTLLLFLLNGLYFTAILLPSVPKHLKQLAEEGMSLEGMSTTAQELIG
jgi:hypothetical protein